MLASQPRQRRVRCFFFFNDTATTEIYTLSLHDALPISMPCSLSVTMTMWMVAATAPCERSEEHTSELQSQSNLVCRLLLEKKKIKDSKYPVIIKQINYSAIGKFKQM